MKINLFDTASAAYLLPFTHTRPAADIRCGILTMRERWQQYLQVTESGSITPALLSKVFPAHYGDDHLYVNGHIFVNISLAIVVSNLQPGQALIQDETVIAIRTGQQLDYDAINKGSLKDFEPVLFKEAIVALKNVWDIFVLNDYALRADFEFLTHNQTSEAIPEGVRVIGDPKNLFLAAGAKIYDGVFNTSTGPVYIDEDAEVMEGVMLRGPLYLGKHGAIKMGAKIYGATTIGHGSKVGGEISNTVFFDYANKGHDGFLGNAVIGSWCNLGADTNSSNLKNNYDEVSIWSEHENRMIKTGLQFCGLLMGDHSKCGINTMFNTGTVVGVSCNIYGGDFPDKFIPSFSWGGKNDRTSYQFDKAIDTAKRMMARRSMEPSAEEIELLKYICKNSQQYN
ncbi:MAG: glucose-1-phosphate thymidylyltransferase [Sphingobacteriales bacterium]|nr:MAG: glucose-1-phosphate thymidylyltransferase [Sphingobacteriales bacterium]